MSECENRLLHGNVTCLERCSPHALHICTWQVIFVLISVPFLLDYPEWKEGLVLLYVCGQLHFTLPPPLGTRLPSPHTVPSHHDSTPQYCTQSHDFTQNFRCSLISFPCQVNHCVNCCDTSFHVSS